MKYLVVAIVDGKIVSKLRVSDRKFMDNIKFPRAYIGADKIHHILSDAVADTASKFESLLELGVIEESVCGQWVLFLDEIYEACELVASNAATLICVSED